MNDPDGKEHRIMNHMEEQMGIYEDTPGAPTQAQTQLYLKQQKEFICIRVAQDQSEAVVLMVKNLLVLVKETDAEDDTIELCRELCLTAEFFNKILQSEKFENIPF